MGVIDFTKTIKNNDGKKGRNNQDIYLSGYHMLGGLVAGLVISKILDKANITDKAKETKITHGILTGHPINNVGDGIKLDKLALMALSTGLTIGEVFFGVKGGASAGAGLILGHTYLQTSKSGYIGEAKG